LNESVFKAATINTPSMLCVEDALDGLNWAIRIGGLKSLIERSEANLNEIAQWVGDSNSVEFLAEDFKTQSCTSVCLNITCEWFLNLSKEKKEDAAKKVVVLLDQENIAYDIGSYRDAPPGLRIWCGGTIEVDDIKALTPWIEWALSEISIEYVA
jgi:phosphoserine aminotransferase